MKLDNFYEILDRNIDERTFRIKINPHHDIFNGHFPGNPVMPGVCMIQIVKELTQICLSKNLFMTKCSNVKFMSLINPQVNSILDISLVIKVDEVYKVKTILKFDDTIALKMNSQYKVK